MRLTRQNKTRASKNAGALFVCPDTSRVLLGLRAPESSKPNLWSIFGGKVEEYETVAEGVQREIYEETGFSGPYALVPSFLYRDPNGKFSYQHYIGIVREEFDPYLNWEHTKASWFDLYDLPNPLHPGVVRFLKASFHDIEDIMDVSSIIEQSSLGSGTSSGYNANAWAPRSEMQKVYKFLWSGDDEK